MKSVYSFKNFEITKREIITSISIISVLLIFGMIISSRISEYQLDKNEMYNKAIKIDSFDLFSYGMKTNVGNAFVYGDLEVIDPVSYPELDGEYMYVEKVKEEYTRHTREVSNTRTVNGKTETYYTTEVYYTWDKVSEEYIKSNLISFCGVEFKIDKIRIPQTEYITTINKDSDTRYKYYGTDTHFTGTLFTELKGGTILDNSVFYNGKNITETVEYLDNDYSVITFWIVWFILICCCVFGFFYLDNKWLK